MAVAVVGGVGAVPRTAAWIGWLPATMAEFERFAVWTTVLAGVVAAYVAGQPRAHGFDEWLESTGRGATGVSRAIAASLGPAAGIGSLLLAGAMLGGSAAAGMQPAADHWMLLLSVPTVMALGVTWIMIGVLLGRAMPRYVALPLAAVLPYVSYAFTVTYGVEGPVAVLAVGDGRALDDLRPTTAVLTLRLLAWLAIAATACAAACFAAPRVVVTTRVLASSTVALALLGGYASVPLHGATDEVCSGMRPRLCVDGAHRTVLPAYRAAVSSVWPTVPAALQTDVVASSMDGSLQPAAEILVAPPVSGWFSPARRIDATQFTARLGEALFTGGCTAEGQVGLESATVLNLWWRRMHSLPVDGSAFPGDVAYETLPNFAQLDAAARAFGALPVARRELWFKHHRGEVRECAVDTPVPT